MKKRSRPSKNHSLKLRSWFKKEPWNCIALPKEQGPSHPLQPTHVHTHACTRSQGDVFNVLVQCADHLTQRNFQALSRLSLSLPVFLSLSPFLLSLSLSLGRKRPRGTQTDRQTQTDRHVDRIGSIVLEFTVCRSFLARGFCCAGCHWWQWRGRQPRGRRALTIR